MRRPLVHLDGRVYLGVWDLGRLSGFAQSRSNAEELRIRKLPGINDSSRNEDDRSFRRIPGKGNCNTEDGRKRIRVFAFEAEAASGHVDAGNETERFNADASEITNFGAP